MIPFFRKIRKKMADDNKPIKYMRYAIGEIVLVVIGILIALSINNWNEERKESKIETILLKQLEKDLTSSLNDITNNINALNRGINSSEFLLNYMETNNPYQDSLAIHFAASFSWTVLIISLGAYETIKSHGIEIISNIELRNQIIDVFEKRLFFQRVLENVAKDYSENMRRQESVKFFKSSRVDIIEDWVGKTVPRDYEILKNDEEFRYHLETYSHIVKSLQKFGNLKIKNKIIDLRDSIRKELNE